MRLVQFSSGDLRADRRLEYGLACQSEGDLEGAISLFQQAIEVAPDWAAAHFTLADALESAGRRAEAVAHFRACLRLGGGEALGAEVRLAVLGAEPAPDRLPPAYVGVLFDQYAGRFEDSLVGRLNYRAPWQLRAAVEVVQPAPPGGQRVLDLGCGTGLAGEAFRSRASWLQGVDLAPAMIERAGAKGVFDALEAADMVPWLEACGRRFDLVVAADVLIYFGALEDVFRAVHRVLEPGGLFALSLQRAEAGAWELGRECRYSHGEVYLRDAADAGGFTLERLETAPCRTEGGREVACLIAVLRRPSVSGEAAEAMARDGDGLPPPVSPIC